MAHTKFNPDSIRWDTKTSAFVTVVDHDPVFADQVSKDFVLRNPERFIDLSRFGSIHRALVVAEEFLSHRVVSYPVTMGEIKMKSAHQVAYYALQGTKEPAPQIWTAPTADDPNAEVPFLIFFDDRDRPPELLIGANRAVQRFKDLSNSWNAHLFAKVQSNSSDEKMPNFSPMKLSN